MSFETPKIPSSKIEEVPTQKNESVSNIEMSAGYKKMMQYAERIKNGASKEEIFKDLPEIFKKGIEKELEKAEKEKEWKKKEEDDKQAANEIRKKIGIPMQGAEYFENSAEKTTKEKIETTKKPSPLTAKEINEIQQKARNKTRIEGNIDLMIHRVDWKIGQRFDAHGLAKIGVANQLQQLLNLLENGINPNKPFYTAPLETNPDSKDGLGAGMGTGGGTAYKDGSFIVLGEIDEKIEQSGIKYVAVNDAYYDSMERLQEAYPEVNFIKADELNNVLKKIADITPGKK